MSLTATMQIMPFDVLAMRKNRATRRIVSADSTLRLMPGVAHDVIVEDLSTTGCWLRSSIPMTVGTRLRLALCGAGATVEGEVVRLAVGGYGCVFAAPISADTFAHAFCRQDIVHVMVEKSPAAFDAPVSDLVAASVSNPASDLASDLASDPASDIARWPRPVRAVVMVGCGVGAWALFGLVVGWI